jgi:hypothetical protein
VFGEFPELDSFNFLPKSSDCSSLGVHGHHHSQLIDQSLLAEHFFDSMNLMLGNMMILELVESVYRMSSSTIEECALLLLFMSDFNEKRGLCQSDPHHYLRASPL